MTLHITLSGHLGAGKSTVSRLLEESIPGMQRMYAGAVFREAAAARNMTVAAFNRAIQNGEIKQDIDAMIDGRIEKMTHEKQAHIFDSRLAWMNVEGDKALKVMLIVHPLEAARRIFTEGRRDETYGSEADALRYLQDRFRAEAERFKKMYGLDVQDFDNFDLIIDTTCGTPEATAAKIKDCYDLKLEGKPFPKFWVSPLNLFSRQFTDPFRAPVTNVKGVLNLAYLIQGSGFDPERPIEIGRVGGNNFIFEGHHRAMASIITGQDLIPAKVCREYELGPYGNNTIYQMLASEDTLATYTYDWEEMVQGFAKCPEMIRAVMEPGDVLADISHLKDFCMWTRAKDPKTTPPFPLLPGQRLDLAKIAENSWEGVLRGSEGVESRPSFGPQPL